MKKKVDVNTREREEIRLKALAAARSDEARRNQALLHRILLPLLAPFVALYVGMAIWGIFIREPRPVTQTKTTITHEVTK